VEQEIKEAFLNMKSVFQEHCCEKMVLHYGTQNAVNFSLEMSNIKHRKVV
jgi:hypothetical protein